MPWSNWPPCASALPASTQTPVLVLSPAAPGQSDDLCWYHHRFREQAQKCTSPLLLVGKRQGQVLMATSTPSLPPSCLFFMTDRHSGLRFLVDTGKRPPSFLFISSPSPYRPLSASGQQLQHRDLWCRVTHPQLRAQGHLFGGSSALQMSRTPFFLHHFQLLVDVTNHRLVDSITQLRVHGVLTSEPSP